MNTVNKTCKILGLAFLLQFMTSFSSGVFLKSAWFAPGDMSETMLKIAANPGLMRANILLDMLTALGVIFLGAMLFLTLRKQNEKMALTAFGFYILEVTLLAVSRMDAFSLLRFSQEYAAAGQPADLLFMGQVAYEAMEFAGGTLHMLAFCLGAILFYTLLYQSGVAPRWMSLWGLIAIFPMLVGTITQIFGYTIPFVFYLPYVPFELVIGLWILVKGSNCSGQADFTTKTRRHEGFWRWNGFKTP
ncbi:MAG: DUF4386 domain-containing protein, partial [Anaerolineae bacterium]|nr:DUF4386 domain-containing protein [Anaerolineae bacterium]